MEINRPIVLSVAGFDPSAGAGVLADIKTFEQHQVYGLGVLTANTFQTDTEVKGLDWIPVATIKDQIKLLMERWHIEWFKIGILESSEVLKQLLQFIIQHSPKAKFIWDPVLHSSSGFEFFKSEHELSALLQNITVLTPNLPEFDVLIGSEGKAMYLSHKTMIYLKGGHREDIMGQDLLYWKGVKYIFDPALRATPKHGSGCILSSAICANLALNVPPLLAFEKAKRYIEKILNSNPTPLGWHALYDQ